MSDPYAAQKSMEAAVRMLLTLEAPSPVVAEAIRILREGMTRAKFKQLPDLQAT